MAKLYPPTDPRHWKGIQQYEIERCEDLGIVSNYYVNDISVYEMMFPELAAESVMNLGIIRAGSPNNNSRGLSLPGTTAIPSKTE